MLTDRGSVSGVIFAPILSGSSNLGTGIADSYDSTPTSTTIWGPAGATALWPAAPRLLSGAAVVWGL